MRKSAATRVKSKVELGSNELIDEVRRSDGPVFVTRRGRAAAVVLDVKSYRHMLEQVRQLEDIKAIRRGLEAANRGETRPWEEVHAAIRGKLGLTRRRHGAGRG